MADALTFSLNGEQVTVTGVAPTTTLLNWLRYDRGLTGTKEGCAEGDCGACTVVVRDLAPDGSLRQRSVNACIQLLPMMHGKDIVTVEHLSKGGALHPVQQAMAAHGGSQCGFCTPGFVMSLWHGYEVGAPCSSVDVADQLAGNLCRCTGYGPILRAAADARALPEAASDRAEAAARLRGAESGPLTYETEAGRFFAPVSSDELAALIEAHPEATILAGATDIGLWVTKHGFRPSEMIYLGNCADLQTIAEADGALTFGAATSHADAMAALAPLSPDLNELWRRFASPQVRSAGTLCGNIANGSPIGDAPPALIALSARVTLRKGDARRTMPLEDFFISYGKQDRAAGEFVESVTVPKPADANALKIYKISKRFDQDITAVLAAIHLTVAEGVVTTARIAFGGMGPVPLRAKRAEAALEGAAFNDVSVAKAVAALAEDVTPITDQRASAAYRLKVAQNLLMKYYAEHRAGPQRITGAGRFELAAGA